jgi:uncharacterized protein YfiM (DUF2279 family)
MNLSFIQSKSASICAICGTIFFLFQSPASRAQSFFEADDSLNPKRVALVTSSSGVIWTGTMAALHFVWYDDYPKSDFHVFDDGREWQQMDKVGHFATSWYISRFSGGTFRWAGVSKKKSALIGMGFSFGYQSTLEILDAFNVDWGFSWWDVGSNALGTLLYFGQEFAWEEQKFKLKFSFHNSGLAQYRPEVLGDNFLSRGLKDYNGQTYWLSFNPVTLIKPQTKFPKWINIAFGYGIDHQLIGDGGTYIATTSGGQTTYEPYRQLYLSLDIDFEKIPTQNRFLKIFFKGLNFFKVPFPALEISRSKAFFKPFYF